LRTTERRKRQRGHDPEAARLRGRGRRRRRSAHIIDGRVPHAILIELLTDAGIGTMVTREAV
jgi:hypothetical protein